MKPRTKSTGKEIGGRGRRKESFACRSENFLKLKSIRSVSLSSRGYSSKMNGKFDKVGEKQSFTKWKSL